MAETEIVPPVTTEESTPPVLAEGTPTEETALTRTEVLSLIASARTEVETKLKQDIEVLAAKSRATDGRYGTANAKLQKMEATLEAVATRGMDDSETRLWKAERAAERATEATTQVSAQQEYEQAQSAFQQQSAAFLTSEGIDSKDERLTTAFAKYAAEAKSYADWYPALVRAAADVHKDERRRVEAGTKTAVEKAREEERAKLRNEQRATDGRVDRGSPATAAKVDFSSMSDEEFIAFEASQKEARTRRQRQLR